MKLTNADKLTDTRSACISIIYELSVEDYLKLIDNAYKDKGGLKAQREPLKSSSALRIRKRMVEDIIAGAVLPPIVVGLIVDEKELEKITSYNPDEFSMILNKITVGNLTIIDGMQRTTALLEAIEKKSDKNKKIRVEFWVATKLNSLIYRMLVLNTGQVPWNLRRQVETVFTSMINEIKKQVPGVDIITIDENNRRTRAGQYHANDVIELYLAFGGRKEKVDTKERLADEFTRLDFIEVTEDVNFAEMFYNSLKYMGLLDIEFGRYVNTNVDFRFSQGQDIFKSQPARVGFITAIAKKILGRPGIEKSSEKKTEDSKILFEQFDIFLTKVKAFNTNNDELEIFLALTLLSEKLSVKSSRVGDFEREFFTKAFDTLIELNFDIPSLNVCWLSY